MRTKYIVFVVPLFLTEFSYNCDEFVVVSTTPSQSRLDNLKAKVDNTQNAVNTVLQLTHHDDDHPIDCIDVREKGHNVSDFYYIKPLLAPQPFLVLCDMKTRGGGWTYVINRFNGSQTFDLPWKEYKRGFGNVGGEFWLGLNNLYYLTGYQIHEVLIELVHWDSKKIYAFYNSFSIGGEDEGYVLKLLEGYEGDAGDSLTYHAGKKFSTKDNDQDNSGGNCASDKGAGWWYSYCTHCLLTGRYYKKQQKTKSDGIYWITSGGYEYTFKQARMMIRRRDNKEILLPHEKN